MHWLYAGETRRFVFDFLCRFGRGLGDGRFAKIAFLDLGCRYRRLFRRAFGRCVDKIGRRGYLPDDVSVRRRLDGRYPFGSRLRRFRCCLDDVDRRSGIWHRKGLRDLPCRLRRLDGSGGRTSRRKRLGRRRRSDFRRYFSDRFTNRHVKHDRDGIFAGVEKLLLHAAVTAAGIEQNPVGRSRARFKFDDDFAFSRILMEVSGRGTRRQKRQDYGRVSHQNGSHPLSRFRASIAATLLVHVIPLNPQPAVRRA